ncbi:MAG: hypothetical protein AAF707_01645 [Pseudomonadota bacterium]
MDSALILLASAAEEAGKAAPTVLFLEDYQWVSLAMAVLLIVFLWLKVPGMIARGLDGKIAEIKQQLDEAKALRTEAEALRDEYAAKIAGAEQDAEAMMEGAKREADAIVAKAEADSAAMVARRERMASDKIAAAEREAVDQVRASAVSAAASASRKLIAERHKQDADGKLADDIIASL